MSSHDPLKAAFDQMTCHAPARDELFVLQFQDRLHKHQLRESLVAIILWSLVLGLGLDLTAPLIKETLLAITLSDWGIFSALLSFTLMIYGFNRTFRCL
jgi:hypothetical protein